MQYMLENNTVKPELRIFQIRTEEPFGIMAPK